MVRQGNHAYIAEWLYPKKIEELRIIKMNKIKKYNAEDERMLKYHRDLIKDLDPYSFLGREHR